jgi:hypothetical protein
VVQKIDERTLDALHMASAITIQAAAGLTIPFMTRDAKQRDAAHVSDLTVIWVESAHVRRIHCDSVSWGARQARHAGQQSRCLEFEGDTFEEMFPVGF